MQAARAEPGRPPPAGGGGRGPFRRAFRARELFPTCGGRGAHALAAAPAARRAARMCGAGAAGRAGGGAGAREEAGEGGGREREGPFQRVVTRARGVLLGPSRHEGASPAPREYPARWGPGPRLGPGQACPYSDLVSSHVVVAYCKSLRTRLITGSNHLI